jgi:DNA-binding SARP family transcriptional activator
VTLLREALHIGARGNYFGPLWWREPAAMARLCAKALGDSIEPEYARMLIRHHRLSPPPDAFLSDAWPWPFRIRTLGAFEVLRHGQVLHFEGGPQKKPLEMLKALIAFGGREVPEERLMDALWPDADGDAGRVAAKANLHRLRKGLGDDGVILLKNGRLSLNCKLCRVDALAFLAATDGQVAPADLEKILSRYYGPFLPDDEHQGWAAPMRERIRRRFIHLLALTAGELERASRLAEAAARYEQAIEIDELDEDHYRRLMECYGRLGRRDKVAQAYERCRSALAARLGIEPSSALRKLQQTLLAPKAS